MKRLHLIVFGSTAAILALAACGSGSSTAKVASVADVEGATTTSAANEVAAMSEQTIVVGGGSSQDGSSGANGDGPNSEAFRTQLLAYAKCMRDKGVDFPDPTFGSDGRPEFGANGPQGGMNRDDPAFQAAETACRTQVGFNFGPGGREGGPDGPESPTTTTILKS